MNITIIAVVVLVVLVVMLMMFKKSATTFNNDLGDCEASGGVCARYCGEGFAPLPFSCEGSMPMCCRAVMDMDPIDLEVEVDRLRHAILTYLDDDALAYLDDDAADKLYHAAVRLRKAVEVKP